jgi:hypothetical protein
MSASATAEPEIVTTLPKDFLRTWEAEFQASIPAEKVRANLRQAFIGRALLKEGAVKGPGAFGQKLGQVDARTYFRWHQSHRGCWEDKGFLNEFFADNPQLRSPGWTPKKNSVRHGATFVGGEVVRTK